MAEITKLWKVLWIMVAICAVLTLGIVGYFLLTHTECERSGNYIVCVRTL